MYLRKVNNQRYPYNKINTWIGKLKTVEKIRREVCGMYLRKVNNQHHPYNKINT